MSELLDEAICKRAGITFTEAKSTPIIETPKLTPSLQELKTIAKEATQKYVEQLTVETRTKQIEELEQQVKEQKQKLVEQLTQTASVLNRLDELSTKLDGVSKNSDLEKEVLQKLRFMLERQ